MSYELNSASIGGNLTADPDVRYTSGDAPTAIARYTLAVNRRAGDADYIRCVVFGKQAEYAEKYLKKGAPVLVTGCIRTGNYTSKDGTGVNTMEVVTDRQTGSRSQVHAGRKPGVCRKVYAGRTKEVLFQKSWRQRQRGLHPLHLVRGTCVVREEVPEKRDPGRGTRPDPDRGLYQQGRCKDPYHRSGGGRPRLCRQEKRRSIQNSTPSGRNKQRSWIIHGCCGSVPRPGRLRLQRYVRCPLWVH